MQSAGQLFVWSLWGLELRQPEASTFAPLLRPIWEFPKIRGILFGGP